MYYKEKRDLASMIKRVPPDLLIEGLVNIDEKELYKLIDIVKKGVQKDEYYDEYYDDRLKEFRVESIIEKKSLMANNSFRPDTQVGCILPDALKRYKDNIYYIQVPYGKVECRYILPEKIERYFYEGDGIWHPKYIDVPYRQQVLLDYRIYDGKTLMFLRGYGPQKINRYAISLYCPDDGKIWLSAEYKDILKIFEEMLCDNVFDPLKECIFEIMDGIRPEYFEVNFNGNDTEAKNKYILKLYNGKIQSEFKRKFGFSQFAFLNLLYHIFNAEDAGIFSRQVSFIGFNAILEGKTVKDAIAQIKQYERVVLSNLNDEEIDKLINDFIWWYKNEVDKALIGIKIDLSLRGDEVITRIYSRISFKNNEYYDINLSVDEKLDKIEQLIINAAKPKI